MAKKAKPKSNAVDPSRLSAGEASKLLSAAAGIDVAESFIKSDIEDGAPTNPDGTINLVAYAAWLVREMKHGE